MKNQTNNNGLQFAYKDSIFEIYGETVKDLIKNCKDNAPFQRTNDDIKEHCIAVFLLNGKVIAKAGHCGPLSTSQKDRLCYEAMNTPEFNAYIEAKSNTLNPQTVYVAIGNEEECVCITPKPGNQWNGKDLYGHLHILGWDLDRDDIDMFVDGGWVQLNWEHPDGTHIHITINPDLYDLLLSYCTEVEGLNQVVDKLGD